jgi:hypothetical protein
VMGFRLPLASTNRRGSLQVFAIQLAVEFACAPRAIRFCGM